VETKKTLCSQDSGDMRGATRSGDSIAAGAVLRETDLEDGVEVVEEGRLLSHYFSSPKP
jgi:hypothetical protein